MHGRERRLAENEIRFRALNERLREGSGTWDAGEGSLELVCECGDEDCTRGIRMSPRDYEAVRSDEVQFMVVPGHQRLEVENVVADCGDWLLVEKRGEAAELAAETDPRG